MFFRKRGFTLIELLIVVAIIALLSSVVLSSLNAARSKARDTERLSELHQVYNALELYATDNDGQYPSTGGVSYVYLDPGCPQSVTSPDAKLDAWIPGLVPTYISSLPQDPKPISGGCYMYSSNGKKYILTAWGTVEGGSNGGRLDSNFGYRELSNMSSPDCYYSTSYPTIDVLHRKSFTITNMTTADFSICPKLGP